jgi:hypothetical protein
MQTTLEMYDAKIALLDKMIAESQALIDARDEAALAPVESADPWGLGSDATCYAVEPRPLAFGLPISHTDGWEHLGEYVLTSAAILPGDSRWTRGGMR